MEYIIWREKRVFVFIFYTTILYNNSKIDADILSYLNLGFSTTTSRLTRVVNVYCEIFMNYKVAAIPDYL